MNRKIRSLLVTEPNLFSTFIGGYMGPSYKVELTGDILTYTRMSNGYEEEEVVTIKPTDDAWAIFLEVLDEIDIWAWKEQYLPSHPICDGTHWNIQLAVGEHTLESSGANSYPTAKTDTDENPFDIFTSALQALLGGHSFR